MNDLIPKTLKYRVDGITIEVCHGEIPEIFRQLNYDPVTEFELPDTKNNEWQTGISNEEFEEWLDAYRFASSGFASFLLMESIRK